MHENTILIMVMKSTIFVWHLGQPSFSIITRTQSLRSGNYSLPCFSCVKFVTVTDTFGGICYSNF